MVIGNKRTPVALIVFGATGDLTQNKLYPALYELALHGMLPEQFYLFGLAKEKMSQKAFEKDIRDDLKRHYGTKMDKKAVAQLIKHVKYLTADLLSPDAYKEIEQEVRAIEKELGTAVMRTFYLALPPSLFSAVVQNVNTCGLGKDLCSKQGVKSRVILEKPFGYDLQTAKKLNALVSSVFEERQIFRIDHYLGKEAFQNIFAFRFGNPMFHELWNRKHIAEIQINAMETVGLEGRVSYYDDAGATRDMLQNHLLQFLAYLTMEAPVSMDADGLRRAKTNLLRKVRLFGKEDAYVRGQYSDYHKEEGIDKKSKTETYIAAKLQIRNRRWKGVPIFIRTGKHLSRKETSATIVFHHSSIFKDARPNMLNIQIAPTPSVSAYINVQAPGFDFETHPADMHYCRYEHNNAPMINDYERLLLDVFDGDQRLFTSSAEVLEGWRIVTPILENGSSEMPIKYKFGSDGPEAANDLLLKNGSEWQDIVTSCPLI